MLGLCSCHLTPGLSRCRKLAFAMRLSASFVLETPQSTPDVFEFFPDRRVLANLTVVVVNLGDRGSPDLFREAPCRREDSGLEILIQVEN